MSVGVSSAGGILHHASAARHAGRGSKVLSTFRPLELTRDAPPERDRSAAAGPRKSRRTRLRFRQMRTNRERRT
ncbi:MAG: hypothetical protein KAI24_17380, partial [Planctomycetes bacterium]|nr:hypothetical protein [Planctomycetota bacterium]